MVNTIENLEEKLQSGHFYYNIFGLYIKAKITDINIEDNKINIKFENGSAETTLDNIEKMEHEKNVATRFDWCYKVKNQFNIEIGYVGYDH